MDTPPFDPAAEAARFCRAAAALATYLRELGLSEAQRRYWGDDPDYSEALDHVVLRANWRECVAAGVTLGELYGVAS